MTREHLPLTSATPEDNSWLILSEEAPQADVVIPIRDRDGEFVRHAPGFNQQVADTTRTNLVGYVPGLVTGRGTHLDQSKAIQLTEHDALVGLQGFLQEVAGLDDGDRPAENAGSMLEDLTFIGEREFNEATAYTASDWKQQFAQNPNLQICAIAGLYSEGTVKSDTYVLDEILKHFSNEEMTQLKGRLVLSPDELDPANESAHVTLVDDWMNEGLQLGEVATLLQNRYPQYRDKMSIQLVVATERRLRLGLLIRDPGTALLQNRVPVNSYFVANGEKHTTGSHGTMDFGFENEFGNMVHALNRARGDNSATTPPLTNVPRPYKQPRYYPSSIRRLRKLSAA